MKKDGDFSHFSLYLAFEIMFDILQCILSLFMELKVKELFSFFFACNTKRLLNSSLHIGSNGPS